MTISHVSLTGGINFANDRPLVLIGGINVLESRDLAMEVAAHFVSVTSQLNIPYVFKASFDKANRSSIHSYRGPGLDAGLALLSDIKAAFDIPVLTDVHEPYQAEAVADVVDIIQLPAFLARQTDLVTAIARTGLVVNVKKPQFLAPDEMRHMLAKFQEAGNDRILLCERGTSFGYNNLVVDMLGMDIMKGFAPVVFDVTHALQRPGGRADSADGRSAQAAALARCGTALGIAGLFIEAHPEPASALCDGPSAIKLADVADVLTELVLIDRIVKSRGQSRAEA